MELAHLPGRVLGESWGAEYYYIMACSKPRLPMQVRPIRIQLPESRIELVCFRRLSQSLLRLPALAVIVNSDLETVAEACVHAVPAWPGHVLTDG